MREKALAGAVLVLFCALTFMPSAFAQTRPEARGVWILETHLASEASMTALLERMHNAGLNMAYIRVWYMGATIYPSDVVQRAGGLRQHPTFNGRDPLAEFIRLAQRYEIQVAAWMEYGLALRITHPVEELPPILRANPTWAMRHRDGHIPVYHGSGTSRTYSYWMDPAHPEVVRFMADMAAEVVTRYPDLAVFETDRFRYPDLNFSFRAESVARYMEETGQPNPLNGDNLYGPWVQWRRAQTTRLMGEVFRAVKRANPSVAVSAAVVPPYMIDSTQDRLQFWPAWADSAYVDFLDPMMYTVNHELPLFFDRVNGLLRTSNLPFYAGTDVSQGNLTYQVEQARQKGRGGIVFWYEGYFNEANLSELATGVFAERTVPPHDDLWADDNGFNQVYRVRHTVPAGWAQGQGGIGGTYREGSSGAYVVRIPTPRAGFHDVYAYHEPDARHAAQVRYTVQPIVREGEPVPASVFTLNQQTASGWVRLGSIRTEGINLSAVEVSIEPLSAGSARFDVLRVVRAQPLRGESVLASAADRVMLRTNFPLQRPLRTHDFEIPGVTVLGVEPHPADSLVVVLEVSPLSDGQSYSLVAPSLEATNGRTAAISLHFTYTAMSSHVTVDDAEAAFRTTGSGWTVVQAADAVGGTFRQATGTAAQRGTWSITVPEEGWYDVLAWIPAGEGRSARAAYQMGTATGFDTLYVSQNAPEGRWARVGTRRFRTGGTLVALIGSVSAPGTLVADALRLERTLSTIGTSAVPHALLGPVGEMSLFPTFTRDRVNVRLSHVDATHLTLSIHDLLGRRVEQHEYERFVSETLLRLDVSHLPSGRYVVRAHAVRPDGQHHWYTASFTHLSR